MNCEYFKELISARLDGELTIEEETVLSGHLSDCDECSRLREEFREQRELHRARKPSIIPADIEKKMLDKTIRSSGRTGKAIGFISGNYTIPKPLAWGVAVTVIILLFTALFRPFEVVSVLKMEQMTVTEPVRIQRVVITENDIKETRTFTQSENL